MSEKKKHPGGRPRLFATPEDFDTAAQEYFDDNEGRKISWTGLCLAVGACSRDSLTPYAKGDYDTDKQKYSDSIKKALMRVEQFYEENDGGAKDIFALKNFGWTDKQELDHTSSDGSMGKVDEIQVNVVKSKK